MKTRNSLRVESLESRAMLTTLFVESGAVGGDGSANAPFGSIQEAVDAAAANPGDDTVMIGAGVYEENVEIEESDALTLKGQGNVVIRHPEIDVDGGDEPDDIIDAEGDVTFQNLNLEGLLIGDDLGGRGIDAKDGSFTLINVSVTGTDGDAVRFRDFGSLDIRNSTFSSLDADGMDIEDGGSVRISNTDASDNDDEGLEVDRVDLIEVVGGSFLGNGDDGIDIDSASVVRVVNVVSEGNGGNGFQAEAETIDMDVTLIGSRLNDNDENGVQVVEDGASVVQLTLIGNLSTNNVEAAFDIDISGSTKSKGNKASGNGDDSIP
ncbi:MAG: right-handed parallel beta-helix repeat-containing protein [Planctomycetales bacterium]|nr:right-handed parallel beta-helix repeat-containing protein [Planctomycetales bacterium]